MQYDAFLSYANEDEQISMQIVGGLKSRGFKIWFAPLNLKIGDRLLDSIENGMMNSSNSILLISKAYIQKGWTNYEMDTLIRHNIEKNKKILPIWHEVDKEIVENRHPGLAGIYALSTDIGIQSITRKITEALSKSAPTIGVIPSYESPKHRFLKGRGEINLFSEDGPATTLWEFLLHAKESDYPIFLEGELYSKEDLLLEAALMITAIPEEVKRWVREEGFQKIWTMCVESGYDPEKLA